MLARYSGTQWFQWHLQPDSVGSSSINTIIESQTDFISEGTSGAHPVCLLKGDPASMSDQVAQGLM